MGASNLAGFLYEGGSGPNALTLDLCATAPAARVTLLDNETTITVCGRGRGPLPLEYCDYRMEHTKNKLPSAEYRLKLTKARSNGITAPSASIDKRLVQTYAVTWPIRA